MDESFDDPFHAPQKSMSPYDVVPDDDISRSRPISRIFSSHSRSSSLSLWRTSHSSQSSLSSDQSTKPSVRRSLRENFVSIASRKRRILVVSGISAAETLRLDGLTRWCEARGEVRSIVRVPNGDLHVDFRDPDVADRVRISLVACHWQAVTNTPDRCAAYAQWSLLNVSAACSCPGPCRLADDSRS